MPERDLSMSRGKPTPKGVAFNTANLILGHKSKMDDEDGQERYHLSMPWTDYQTSAAASDHTKLYSEGGRRRSSSRLTETPQVLQSQRNKLTDSQDCGELDGRRQIGVKKIKYQNFRPLHQEISMTTVTREYHVFLSEAYKETVPEEAEPVEPLTNKQAMDSPEWELWHDAKELENKALVHKRVMVLVDIKPGMKIIKSKYVFKIKKKFGKISRYKARLVALGYDQEIDPQLNFAPVVKPNTVRMLMALAQVRKMSIHQIDISNAFCCADIEGEVHISAPKGMDIPEGKCFKLLKSLYGLRTSPKSWNKTIDN